MANPFKLSASEQILSISDFNKEKRRIFDFKKHVFSDKS